VVLPAGFQADASPSGRLAAHDVPGSASIDQASSGSAGEDNKDFMGFRRIAPILLLSTLLMLVSALAASGQDKEPQVEAGTGAEDPLLAEARDLSDKGKFPEAAEAYTKWLAENGGHPDFGLILMEAADSQLSVERALELLRVYTPRVQDQEQRDLCRASQIDLLEMLGRTEQALGLLRSFPPSPRWLYRQARLLYQEGLTEDAEKSLQQALKALLSGDTVGIDRKNHGQNGELEARIRLLQARIFAVQERDREAESLFQLLIEKYGDTALEPGILLAYYEYLVAREREEAAEVQLEFLARKFPDSPELALARSDREDTGGADEGEEKIGYAPSPSRLLPRQPQAEAHPPAEAGLTADARPTLRADAQPPPEAKPTADVQPPPQAESPAESPASAQPAVPTALVQTGSFRDRENAEYMVGDLESSGFAAEIVDKRIGGTLYYRVVIGPLMTVEQAQVVLMKLKDASFEGVLLFPD
jgi:cell division septation protein DedD